MFNSVILKVTDSDVRDVIGISLQFGVTCFKNTNPNVSLQNDPAFICQISDIIYGCLCSMEILDERDYAWYDRIIWKNSLYLNKSDRIPFVKKHRIKKRKSARYISFRLSSNQWRHTSPPSTIQRHIYFSGLV